MALTRSDLLVFSTGLAVGALACATYPKWKGKLAPLLAAALAGAGAAFGDATSQSGWTAEEGEAPEDTGGHSTMTNGTGAAAPSAA